MDILLFSFLFFLALLGVQRLLEKREIYKNELQLLLYGGHEIFYPVGLVIKAYPILLLIFIGIEVFYVKQSWRIDGTSFFGWTLLFVLGQSIRLFIQIRSKEFFCESLIKINHLRRPSIIWDFLYLFAVTIEFEALTQMWPLLFWSKLVFLVYLLLLLFKIVITGNWRGVDQSFYKLKNND